MLLALSIPISWLYIQSVKYCVIYFEGEIFPSRFIGFSIGMIVFTSMALILFKEPITLKTFICMVLSFGIFAIQVIIK